MRKFTLFSALFCLSLLILMQTGCGFRLRNSWPIPEELHSLYLQTDAPYSYLTLHFKKMLRSLDVKLTENPQDADITMKLYDEQYITTVISESASASTKEYQLNYQISYTLLNKKGRPIYGPQAVYAYRHLLISEDQVLSSANESEVSKQELQRDALYQILNQLSSKKVSAAIKNDIDKSSVTSQAS